mmetsp:Transcript_40727/g.117926  ORF Transcript_40727/g.117926 Transcript_40727/m.117926 type:complete len:286 (+) Transcript_40727:3594-4451(+)
MPTVVEEEVVSRRSAGYEPTQSSGDVSPGRHPLRVIIPQLADVGDIEAKIVCEKLHKCMGVVDAPGQLARHAGVVATDSHSTPSALNANWRSDRARRKRIRRQGTGPIHGRSKISFRGSRLRLRLPRVRRGSLVRRHRLVVGLVGGLDRRLDRELALPITLRRGFAAHLLLLVLILRRSDHARRHIRLHIHSRWSGHSLWQRLPWWAFWRPRHRLAYALAPTAGSGREHLRCRDLATIGDRVHLGEMSCPIGLGHWHQWPGRAGECVRQTANFHGATVADARGEG